MIVCTVGSSYFVNTVFVDSINTGLQNSINKRLSDSIALMKLPLLLCALTLLYSTAGCGGKKAAEPVDPAAALETRMKAAEKMSDPVTQAEEYLAIAGEQQKSAQLPASVKSLKLAAAAVGKVTTPAAKGRLAAEVAIMYARAKQAAESQTALGQAQAALAKLGEDALARTLLQARIAVAQQELGSKQTAQTTLQASVNGSAAIMDVEAQTRAWLGVAAAAKALEDTATLQTAFDKATAAAKSATMPRQQSELLEELARTQHEVDQNAAAEETLTAALAIIATIDDPLNRGYALLEAAGTRVLWGDAEQGKALLDQLEKLLATVPDKDQAKQLQAKVKTQRSQLAKLKK